MWGGCSRRGIRLEETLETSNRAQTKSPFTPKKRRQADNPALVRLSEVMTMTTSIHAPASATRMLHIPLAAFGLSLSLFFAITFVLCVLFGLLVSVRGIHEVFPTILDRK